MLKYIVTSGIALSVLYFLSEIGVNALGNTLKTKREAVIPIKIQLKNALKNRRR